MSINSSLSGVTFGGIASGIDTESIISKLVQIERVPIQRLQQKQSDLGNTSSAYDGLSSRLTTLNSAATSLSSSTTFQAVSGSSSDSTVATISAGSTSIAGTYNLSVTALAQAQKVSSSAQTDTTSALNLTGNFVINGQSVSVVASDSISAIASKVNNLGNGVTASVINGGTGAAYLTFTSSTTGAVNKVQAADTSGSVLQTLGILGGATSTRETVTNGLTSYNYSSQTTTVASQQNSTGVSGTIKINGVSVAVNTATDSLQTIANNINAANTGATASIRSVTNNGTTTYKLDITQSSGAPTLTDSNNVLQSLGYLQQGYSKTLVAAQDASYSLDGVSLTSSTNTISNAISGATLTLLKGTTTNSNNVTGPSTATISLSKDTSGIKTKINNFVSAYNDLQDYINQNSTFDSKTYQTGVLFGDSLTQQVEDSIGGSLFNNVAGLSGSYTNLTSIGLSLDSNSKITVDDTKLTNAINTAGDKVAALFNAAGSASTTNLSFVTTGSKTKASTATPYAVNITQVATQGSYTGQQAQTQNSTQAETLTFSGNLFGNTPYKLTVASGSSASNLVNLINSDATLSQSVSASLDSTGKLKITSKNYGTSGNFTAVSNLLASSNNSGLGVGSLGTSVTGLDVAGTINGEAATGSGQFLTGKSGNSTTDGLQIQYTGTSTGNVGTMNVTLGIGPIYTSLISAFTDSTNGYFTAAKNSISTENDQLSTQITDLQTSLDTYTTTLRQRFSAMEQAISSYQRQSQQLQSLGK